MARTDIDALNATFVQGLEKGDPGLIASVHAEDGRVLAPGSEAVSGRAAIEQFWQGALGQGLTGGSLSTVSLEEQGDLAVEEGRYELTAGNQVVDTGKYVVVHRRQPDGTWRYGIDIWNSDQAPPS
ncbi:YybH family protein [Geodermatophilus sp. SYSU D00779]